MVVGGSRLKGEEKRRRSEARENLVILRTAASLMDSVCVCRVHAAWLCGVLWARGGRRGWVSRKKGCVYPICSLPLPCGRKNHWLPALCLILKEDWEEADALKRQGEEEVGHKSKGQEASERPHNHSSSRTSYERVSVCLVSVGGLDQTEELNLTGISFYSDLYV